MFQQTLSITDCLLKIIKEEDVLHFAPFTTHINKTIAGCLHVHWASILQYTLSMFY